MTLPTAMHLLGITCLGGIASICAIVLREAFQDRRRIWSTMLGRNIPPATPTASSRRASTGRSPIGLGEWPEGEGK